MTHNVDLLKTKLVAKLGDHVHDRGSVITASAFGFTEARQIDRDRTACGRKRWNVFAPPLRRAGESVDEQTRRSAFSNVDIRDPASARDEIALSYKLAVGRLQN